MPKSKVRKKVALPTKTLTKKAVAKQLGTHIGFTADIPYQNLRGKSLFVATPMYGGQCTGIFTKSMMVLADMCKELGIAMNPHFLFNESLIPRGRNYCADEFLRARHSGPDPRPILDAEGKPVIDEKGNVVLEEDNRPFFTHMLFIDSDIGFDPRDIIFMLAISDPGNDKDVVCAGYPKKCIAWEKIKAAVDQGYADGNPNDLENFVGDYVFNPKTAGNIPLNQPVEILEGGTGFMLIQRQAFAKFDAKFPTQAYRPDHVRTKAFDGSRPIMAYFDCPIDRGYTFQDIHDLMHKAAKGEDVKELANQLIEQESKSSMRYLSEDYMFCQYLQKAGANIWLVPWIKLIHMGSYMFGGSLLALSQLQNVSATADPTKIKHR